MLISPGEDSSDDPIGADDDNAQSPVIVTALHPYEPAQSDEIQLHPGDQLQLLSDNHHHSGAEGWWVGQELANGRIDVFPSSYVIPPSDLALDPLVIRDRVSSAGDRCQGHASVFDLSRDPVPANDLDTDSISRSTVSLNGGTIDQTMLDLDGQVMLIDPAEIKDDQLQFIGSGAFGTVYRGNWLDEIVALKVLNLPTNQLNKEASHLRRLSHRNIVRFHGVCELGAYNSPALVMEFAHGGPLNGILAEHPALSPSTLLDWAVQIATGMFYLHSEVNLVHRDLKSSNILIREPLNRPYVESELCHCTLLITDFGMACQSTELVSQQSKLGTVAYAAPEVCRQALFSYKSDVWSYGVVLWELLTLETPFRNMEQPRLLYLIAMFSYTLHIPDDVPDLFKTLLRDCWSPLPANRPSFERILPRLGYSTYCDFLTMDSAELSRIQLKWRESISAHHQEEHEVPTDAATMSSNVTNESQSLPPSNANEHLSLHNVLLQHGWESLDQHWQQLAAREQEVDLKEEHYTRLVGTMGHQFTLLAVLAANQLKDLPTDTKGLEKPQTPPPPRKRPFVRNLFRWGGIAGSEMSTDQNGKVGLKNRKVSTTHRNTVVTNASSSSTGTTTFSSHNRNGMVHLPPASSGKLRSVRPRAGVPHISPPVNMKHVVHVDHDWITGHGLTDSSMRLFPAALVENSVNIRGWHSTPKHRGSPDRTHLLLHHLPTRNQQYCSLSQAFLDLATGRSRKLHEVPSETDQTESSSLSCGSTSSNQSGLRPPVQRFYRGTPGVLRKTGQSDVCTKIGPCSHQYRNLFGPYITSDPEHEVRSHFPFADMLTGNNSCECHANCSARTKITQWGPSRKAAAHDCSVLSNPRDRPHFLETGFDSPLYTAFPELGQTDRRRWASGPIAPRSRNHCSAEDLCWLRQDLFPMFPDDLAFNNLASVHRSIISESPFHGDPKHPPRSVAAYWNRNRSTSHASHLNEMKNSIQPPSTCVESALWRAFQLVFLFTCTQEADVTGPLSLEPRMTDPSTFCLNSEVSHDSGHALDTSVSPTTMSPPVEPFCPHRSSLPIRTPCLFTNASSSEQVFRRSTGAPPLLDLRRRIQSADRCYQPTSYSCAHCNRLALHPEFDTKCMIAHHAAFGDPHSPFLGMLAGSGRRPNIPGDSNGSTNHSTSTRCNAFLCSSHFRHHCCTCCTHLLSPSGSYKVPPFYPMRLHVCPHHPNSHTSSHSHCPFCLDHTNFDATANPPVCYGCACCSSRGCRVTCVENFLSQSSDLVKHTEAAMPTSSFGVRNGEFVESLCSHSSLFHRDPIRTHKAGSHPSLPSAVYNPVAHSRDAYLKATRDGYLNRTPHVPSSSVPDSQFLDTFSISHPFVNHCRDIIAGNAVYDVTHSTAAHVPKGNLSGRSDGESASDSDSIAECPSHYRVQQDEDGLTLVPNDGWNRRNSHSSIPFSVLDPNERSPEHTSSNGLPRAILKNHALRRRPLHRSPAMRSLNRPNILAFTRNHSLPESSELCYQCTESTNARSRGASGPPISAPRKQTASPCGPYVSMHSTLL